jgi:hypothetical protein
MGGTGPLSMHHDRGAPSVNFDGRPGKPVDPFLRATGVERDGDFRTVRGATRPVRAV